MNETYSIRLLEDDSDVLRPIAETPIEIHGGVQVGDVILVNDHEPMRVMQRRLRLRKSVNYRSPFELVEVILVVARVAE